MACRYSLCRKWSTIFSVSVVGLVSTILVHISTSLLFVAYGQNEWRVMVFLTGEFLARFVVRIMKGVKMTLRFSKPIDHNKVWGIERWIVNDDPLLYCSKFLFVKRLGKCSYHFHKKKTETFYLCKGLILITVNGDVGVMYPGDVVTIKPGTKHSFIGVEDSLMLETSTYHYESDSYRKNNSRMLTEHQLSTLIAKYVEADISQNTEDSDVLGNKRND